MTDSAQDYTHEVLSVDSNYQVTIQVTSYDSLQSYLFYSAQSGDSDGTISTFVEKNIGQVLIDWEGQRVSAPTLTIGTPVSGRYKTRREDEKPIVSFLRQRVDQYDSETSDEIITHYSVHDLTDSEKSELYSALTTSKDVLWTNLLEGGYVDSVASDLGIDDPVSSRSEIEVRFALNPAFYDSGLQRIKTALSLADSDLASLMVE